MSTPVKTAKVSGRRKLDYSSLQHVLADADRLSTAPVKPLGNWSAGQVFNHLAFAYNGSIDGFAMTFPWYMRTMAKLLKRRLIAGQMPAGFNLPSKGSKQLAPPEVSTEDGLARLHEAVARLDREPNRACQPHVRPVGRKAVEQHSCRACQTAHEFSGSSGRVTRHWASCFSV